jgi:hypothetical protein
MQTNQQGFKLNGTDQFWVCADDDRTFGESIHTIHKNTEL